MGWSDICSTCNDSALDLFSGSKHSDGWWNIATKLALALTLAQGTWAIVYFALGETSPVIWLAPAIVFLIACLGFVKAAAGASEQ